MTVVKNEETGLISSAAVVSAESENPDDGEFRDQEILCQILLFSVSIFIFTLCTTCYMEIQIEFFGTYQGT